MRRLKQIEVAAAVGCHPAHLNAVLNGDRDASDRLKRRLAVYLGCAVSDLFRDGRRCVCGRVLA